MSSFGYQHHNHPENEINGFTRSSSHDLLSVPGHKVHRTPNVFISLVEIHAVEIHAVEIHAVEIHAVEIHAVEIHAVEIHAVVQ